MWPFKRRKKKPDWRARGMSELKKFRRCGQTFKYMGVEMKVVKHYLVRPQSKTFPVYPMLVCDYVDSNGVFQQMQFEPSQLPTLRRENPEKI